MLFVSINANPHGYVVEVAKVASPVGSHGPALINLHWPNSWPGSYWGKEQGGSWGSSGNYISETKSKNFRSVITAIKKYGQKETTNYKRSL